jgi:Spy/CpxP family protein refolding chaperone
MKSLSALFVAASLLVSLPSLADPAPAPNAGPGWFAESVRSRVLRDKVGLSDEKARKVEAILDKYRPEQKKVTQGLREARKKLEALITLNSDDQAAYQSVLQQLRTNQKARADLMDRAFTEISKDLTPKEQGRLFVALQEVRGKLLKAAAHGRGPAADDGAD